jgi:deoxyribodipyrimidine photo-lyase
MQAPFTTSYAAILQKIENINPVAYGKTRNYIHGDVTYLSPYISRGVISTQQVLNSIIRRGFKLAETEQFVKELAWRDYFQRVWQTRNINEDLKSIQTGVTNFEIPLAVLNATCGINGVDVSILNLFETGYMHNHCRMYTASIICNIAKSHWLQPAKWMYYYLLDGDWASNACSWQWVAGSNSNKKYFANQENISKFTKEMQHSSFVDEAYNDSSNIVTPTILKQTSTINLLTHLPASSICNIDENKPTFIYNYYNLDPLWHLAEEGNRVLLLEPSHFFAYPISEKCVDFMLALSKNILSIQIYVGEFDEFVNEYQVKNIYYKEHPLNKHYKGFEESRDWICSSIVGYFPSFFAFWKQIEKEVKKQFS